MKKVLFSSVCAVALLGINAYAVENSGIGNSLESFLSQKADLENKINAQNSLITQKQESVNTANNNYLAKDKAYKDLSTAITNAITTAGEKEDLKNKAELEHTNLINQGNSLNTQKENLNQELQAINDLITKQNTAISDLTSQIATSKINLDDKEKTYNNLVAQLDIANTKHKDLVNAEIKATDEHKQALVALENDPTNTDLKNKVEEAYKRKEEAHLAVKISDGEIAPLADAKGKALYEYTTASEQHNTLVFKQREEEKNLEKYKSNQTLKQQEIQTHEQKILENKNQQTLAQTKINEALKVLQEAQAKVEAAKQNQANALTELDAASVELEKAKQDLDSANLVLSTLKKELEDLQNSVTTEESLNKAKEELGEFNLNNKDSNDLMILLAAANNDLSTATPEVKAEAKKLADKIATTIINEEKSEISSNALSALNVSINNMNKRLGEVRGLNADLGAWFRIYGGRFSDDTSHFNYYSTQIGADKKTSVNNAEIITGALFGYDKVNANVKSTGISIGAYLSYIHNDGYFADLVLKYLHTSYDKDAMSFKNQNSFLLSAESGYRFNLKNNFYLEPSLELITGYVGKYQSSEKSKTITVDSYMPFIIKPQVFAGYSVNELSFRAGIGAIIDTKKHTANLLISDIVKGINANAQTKLDKNNRGFVSLGTAYKFSDNLRLNFSIERSFGSSLTNDYELNSTIRYTF